jgi:diketogulonate reductase-like aldo/keto reductase
MAEALASSSSVSSSLPVKKLRSGFSLPVLGLGTWLMGGEFEPDPHANLSQEIEALQEGLSLGFRHIDTAELYANGNAEKIVADAIKVFPRSQLTLASKVFPTHHGYDALLASLKASLQRLQTPYLDIYYLHAPNLEIPLVETARALNEARRDGLIRHIAVSNFLPARIEALQQHLDSPIVANQVHFNLAFREPDAVGMFDHALKHDYFVVAWRPLRLQNRHMTNGAAQKNVWERGAYTLLDSLADKTGKTNTQIALNWVAAYPQTVALIKSSNPVHLREAAESWKTPLNTGDIEKLSRDFTPQFKISDTIPLK